ncbi:MAG: universal stress protein [Salegentibacter sp.]|uniref:universal stress protein n=1 Tax=Salegentibacter sp. TaxID=1903072 RepID=UPI002870AD89|nr:universal stress protein [Salegentibacter sp.]MDR9457435.1 universal stress protein [Salegentibacter sp.]
MRKIVFPTDFSENAFNALKYAVELLKYETCEFFLLHAYADEVYNDETILSRSLMDELKEKVLNHAEVKLEETLEKIREIAPNPHHTFHKVASFGALVDEVNDLVDSENADLCIMGTRGKSDDRNISFGTNTLLVMKYVQCPVLSIPAGYKYNTPENILFLTNFLVPYQKRELKLVSEIARVFGSEIHSLYISKYPVESFRQKDNLNFLKEQFVNIKFQTHQVDGIDKVPTIMDFIEKHKIDILVMVNSRHSELENILFEGTLDKISLNPKIPLLVLQNFNRECV